MAQLHIVCGSEKKTVNCNAGENLLNVLRESGVPVAAHCNGRGHCGKCAVEINGGKVLSCQSAAEDGMEVVIPEPEQKMTILTDGVSQSFRTDGTDRYAIAFDIGTTTLVCYLLDGRSGEALQTVSRLNPQGSYGADVISRIQHAQHGGAEQLRNEIRDALCEMVEQAAKAEGICPEEITMACVVGNTAMHHLFLGIDPSSLVIPPYMPEVKERCLMDAAEAIPVLTRAKLRVLPNIAGFVGADTTGCMEAVGFDQLDQLTLLLDIGTNGEMVLGSGKKRIACSTAAGPAFEGANISGGMRGAAGAIDHVICDEEGNIRCHVIGEGEAKGICGSGLIDLIYVLLKTKRINPAGRIVASDCPRDAENHKYIPLRDGVCVTQQDIRQLQLAKAAIRSGIELMAQEMGVEVSQIEQVYLAGAFGNYLDAESACGIGLIPGVLRDRIVPIGNAAGTGARICALSAEEFERTSSLAAETEFLELSTRKEFNGIYLKNLNFTQ